MVVLGNGNSSCFQALWYLPWQERGRSEEDLPAAMHYWLMRVCRGAHIRGLAVGIHDPARCGGRSFCCSGGWLILSLQERTEDREALGIDVLKRSPTGLYRRLGSDPGDHLPARILCSLEWAGWAY